ncbi:MAG: polysaccharide pyruvyl transferase family protein [Pseudomonas sp.]|uniref:polysaccharide pyruvyl transferase family protein n=1 Tax=Pseudomonas sp. TaxID=306 RepID=UPI003981DE32
MLGLVLGVNLKIGMVTVHKANNYGAVLQAYALQQCLAQYGEVEIIDYDNRYIGRTLWPLRWIGGARSFLSIAKDLVRLAPRVRLLAKFNCFIRTRYRLSAKYSQSALMARACSKYNCYVVGSDQVWNSNCVSLDGALDPIYFLGFAPQDAIKISYASSLGGYKFTEQEIPKVHSYLQRFNAVSVREQDSQQYLSDLGISHVQHVLDPTLLLGTEQWRELVEPSLVPTSKYILVYSVPRTSLLRQAVDYFAAKKGLKVISIDQDVCSVARVDKQIRDAGPLDFLALFSGAEFVLTDSFHGVCFSIIFGCPFVAVSPGTHSNRVESLLKVLGLESQFVSEPADFERVSQVLDFDQAYARLASERARCFGFLDKALAG